MDLKNFRTAVAAGAVVLLLAGITFIHLDNFRDRIAFWENAARNSPHYSLAQRTLGEMYYLDGRLKDSAPQYKKALALNPDEPLAHGTLGLIYEKEGDLKEAEQEYRDELATKPKYDLGPLYAKLLLISIARGERIAAARYRSELERRGIGTR